MRYPLIIATLVGSLTLLASPALANHLVIQQFGFGNQAGGAQLGHFDSIYLWQHGHKNKGVIHQAGNGNFAGVSQRGNNNDTDITEDGDGAWVSSSQDGNGGSVSVSTGSW